MDHCSSRNDQQRWQVWMNKIKIKRRSCFQDTPRFRQGESKRETVSAFNSKEHRTYSTVSLCACRAQFLPPNRGVEVCTMSSHSESAASSHDFCSRIRGEKHISRFCVKDWRRFHSNGSIENTLQRITQAKQLLVVWEARAQSHLSLSA